jgi:GNAT superfamily N-acetyltransferase
MKHNLSEEWSWLFRLAVDQRYRKKGIGLLLTQTAQNWARINRFNYMELVITECQEEARQLFANAGFQIKQMYHKRLFTSIFTIQMCQLRAEVRSTFK